MMPAAGLRPETCWGSSRHDAPPDSLVGPIVPDFTDQNMVTLIVVVVTAVITVVVAVVVVVIEVVVVTVVVTVMSMLLL